MDRQHLHAPAADYPAGLVHLGVMEVEHSAAKSVMSCISYKIIRQVHSSSNSNKHHAFLMAMQPAPTLSEMGTRWLT